VVSIWDKSTTLLVLMLLEMVAGDVRRSKSDIVLSLYSSGLFKYRMTRPVWPLHHRADSGAGLSGFPIDVAAVRHSIRLFLTI